MRCSVHGPSQRLLVVLALELKSRSDIRWSAFGSCHAASMTTLRQPTQRLPRFRRSGSVPADAQASLDWRPKDIALAARAIRNSWLFPRGRPAQRGGLPLFGFRNRPCRNRCVISIFPRQQRRSGGTRCRRMTRAFGRAKRANPNRDARTEERASSAETGGVAGREAVTATNTSAQTTSRICQLKVKRALWRLGDQVFSLHRARNKCKIAK